MRKIWYSMLLTTVLILMSGCSVSGSSRVSEKETEWFQGQWISTTTPKFVLGVSEDEVLITHAMLGKVETTKAKASYDKQDELVTLILEENALRELLPSMFENIDKGDAKGILMKDNAFEEKTNRESLLLTVSYPSSDVTDEKDFLTVNFVRANKEKEESDLVNKAGSEESSINEEKRELTDNEIEAAGKAGAEKYNELSNKEKAVIMATLKNDGQTADEVKTSYYSVIDKPEEHVMIVGLFNEPSNIEKVMIMDTEQFTILDSTIPDKTKDSSILQKESTTNSSSGFSVPQDDNTSLIGNWKISGIAGEIIVSPYGATHLFGNEKFALENPKTINSNTIDYSSNFSINGSANISKVQLEWISYNEAKARFYLDDGRTITEDLIKNE